MFHFPSELRGEGHTAITKSPVPVQEDKSNVSPSYGETWAGGGGAADGAGAAAAGAASAWMAAVNCLATLLSMSRFCDRV